jgi:hypothetical protein
MCISTLSLTSALDGGGWSRPRPSRSTPPPRSSGLNLYEIVQGGWVGPRAGLDGCGKSRPNPYRVAIPANPLRCTNVKINYINKCNLPYNLEVKLLRNWVVTQ